MKKLDGSERLAQILIKSSDLVMVDVNPEVITFETLDHAFRYVLRSNGLDIHDIDAG